jgi:hypothetical protein
MNMILLDDNQATVVSESREPIEVYDPARKLLGHIVPDGYVAEDQWIERYKEWYFETED